ncbi:phosphonopyruvate decarboxylase [Thiocapsa rosea]|uniref:Phosphonopyruvate decarboxylase n=1 Tax=Thiocapsa rosea TaxID=69360 RepID=A0A495VA99_9GAMM|nr:phosphonopyruvate decarboxylase [Thiocapsa rosea]RKT45553.1 phosphonopyruvate decarboxylase [Thiocapsa rosea]
MINLTEFYTLLKNAGVDFVTGVPDTLLNDFCLGLNAQWPGHRHVIAANEGNAIALATGYHLATGTVPLVYMQNSGMGNAINPLVSLADPAVYGIPMVLLIGWRGEPGSGDWPQHQRQGELSPILLDALRIPYQVLDIDETRVHEAAQWAVSTARAASQPTALLVKKNILARKEKAGFDMEEQQYLLSREDAIRTIISSAPEDTIYVASTGRITREIHAIRDALGQPHDRDFLNVGAMGHALSIAAGIAVARSDRHVMCIDGDGASIMHLGSLPATAHMLLPNLIHVVLNNGAHESVGGQPTAAFFADLTGIATASGYVTLQRPITTHSEITSNLTRLMKREKTSFLEIRIRKGMRTNTPILKIRIKDDKRTFMQSLAAE